MESWKKEKIIERAAGKGEMLMFLAMKIMCAMPNLFKLFAPQTRSAGCVYYAHTKRGKKRSAANV